MLAQEAADEIERLRKALDNIIGICLAREDGLSAAKVRKIASDALRSAPLQSHDSV